MATEMGRMPFFYNQEGRLVQVDYALQAVSRGSTTLGLKTKDFALLSSQVKPTRPLMEPAEKVFVVDEHIGATGSGYIGDVTTLLDQRRAGHRPLHAGDRGRQRRQDADRTRGRDRVRKTLRAPARPEQRRVDHPALPSFLPAPQRFARYTSCFWPGTRSTIPRASRSSFVPSIYHGIDPSNLPLSFRSTASVSS